MAFVYLIQNLITGQSYVGVTSRSLDKRFKEHVNNALRYGCSSYLYNAIRKYGPETFCCSKLSSHIGMDEAYAEEIRMIEYLRYIGASLYNISSGGNGSSSWSGEMKNKQSQRQTGRNLKPKTKKRISDSLKGRSLPESHRLAIKAALNKPECIKKRKAIFSGRPLSKDHKEAISAGMKSRMKNPAERAKSSMPGEQNPRAQLRAEDVKAIRKQWNIVKRFSAPYEFSSQLADIYGVTPSAIYRVITWRSWKNV